MECPDDHSFRVEVDPWCANVSPDTNPEFEWILDGPGGATMEIRPKDPSRWPFPPGRPPPDRVPPNNPIRAGRVRPGAGKGKYRYSILLTWEDSGGNTRSFDIDPDIYILD